MFIKSIRFKITLLYVAILFIILSFFSLIIYQNFSKMLYTRQDNLLLLKAYGIIDSINTYWEAEKYEALKDGRTNVYTKANNQYFAKIAQNWVENKSEMEGIKDNYLLNMIIQIFDAKGKHIVSTKDIPQIKILPKEIYINVSQGKIFINNIVGKSSNNHPIKLRELTIAVTEKGKIAYVIQIASSLDRIIFDLRSLKSLIWLFLPLTAFVSGIAGYFLASQTLTPTRILIENIKNVSALTLNKKIPIPDTNDEIQSLAEHFNEMLMKLNHSFLAQKRFVQDASHEIKTPLTIIRGEIEVLLKQKRKPIEYENALVSVLEEITRLTNIVNSLLALVSIDNLSFALDKKLIRLQPFFLNIIKRSKLLVKDNDLNINLTCDKEITVLGDNDYLTQVFFNLTENSIKYSKGNLNIDISVEKTTHFCEITFCDNGIGIADEDLPFIFDRLFKANKARNGEGFGLGLSIVQAIILAHNGSISVKNHENQGTIFTIKLPV